MITITVCDYLCTHKFRTCKSTIEYSSMCHWCMHYSRAISLNYNIFSQLSFSANLFKCVWNVLSCGRGVNHHQSETHLFIQHFFSRSEHCADKCADNWASDWKSCIAKLLSIQYHHPKVEWTLVWILDAGNGEKWGKNHRFSSGSDLQCHLRRCRQIFLFTKRMKINADWRFHFLSQCRIQRALEYMISL